METDFYKMTKSVGENLVGETYELDTKTAGQWVTAGLCEKVANPTNDAIASFEKKLAERDNDLVNKLSDALAKPVNLKVPAVARGDDKTKNFGEYAAMVGKAMCSRDPRTKETAYNTLENKYESHFKTAMTEGTGTGGGFLVPVEYSEQLLSVPGYEGLAYPDRARIIPIGKATAIKIPALDQTVSPSGGSSAFYGGVAVSWTTENNQPSENQPQFKQITLTPQKVMAYTQISHELLDNSPISVPSLLMDLFRKAIVAEIDYNVVQGSGSGSTPFTGFVDNAATVSVPRATVNTIKYADVCNLYQRLTPGSVRNAVWTVHPKALGALLQMVDTSGRSVWFVGQNASGFQINSLFGLPVVAHEAMPTLGSDGDLCLVDLKYYVIGVNEEVTMAASEHIGFLTDSYYYRVTTRLIGQPQITAPITLMDGSTTVSPFCQLKGATS